MVKKVIGYYNGNVLGGQLADILKNTVKLLIEEEIEVVCISCDQGPPNRMAYKNLGVKTDKPYYIVYLFLTTFIITKILWCLDTS